MEQSSKGDSLGELLTWQHGVLSRAQAAEHGISDNALAARLRSGKWQRVRPGVYATFSGPLPRQSQLWAALLYAGPGAALCDHSAAEIDRLINAPRDSTIHVLVPAHRRIRSQPGIHVRRCRRHAAAVRLGASPPRTRIEETVLDLVHRAPTPDAAFAVLASACQRRLTTPVRLAAVCGSRRNLRWRSLVQPALRDIASGAHSLLELRYVRDVERRHGLPTGHRQRSVQRAHGREWTDVSYDDYATVVELDGRWGHDDVASTWRDLRRDNAAVVAGETPLRYGWSDVTGRPCATASQVAVVLRSHGWTGKLRRCGNKCAL